MNIDKINQNLRKMKRSVIFMENHVNNFFELNQHYNHSKINPVFVRNVQYINNVLQIVKDNVNFMKTLDRNVPGNRFIMKKKFIISLILMKHLNDITSKNSFEDVDFEIENILNTRDKIPKFLACVPKSYHEPVLEEFENLKKNQKIIEGFSLSSLGKVFGFIASAFKMIINSLVEIGKFIGTMLIKFVMLMWKLLMMIMNLIFKIIPKLVKGFFNFIKLLFSKLVKVGIFSMMIFVLLILAFTQYMIILLEMPMPDPAMAIVPAFIVTIHLFWNATSFLWRLQMAILNGIIWIISGPIKYFFIIILGLPKDDRFFRYKGNNIAKKSLLFIAMLLGNIAMIIVRFFISLLGIKWILKYAVPKLAKGLPDMRDIMLFPLIIVQYIYNFFKRILKFFFT